jgi:hypothetical protein
MMFTTFNLRKDSRGSRLLGLAPTWGFSMTCWTRFAAVLAGVVAVFAAPGVAHAGSAAGIKFTPQTAPATFDYGVVDGVGGKTKTQVFTLTNSGSRTTSALKVALSGSAAFTKRADTCTKHSLEPKKTCKVTVVYAPTTNGQIDTATLTATGRRCGPALASTTSITLNGSGGIHNVSVIPDPYDFGKLPPGQSATHTFTATNNGNGSTGTYGILNPSDPHFTLSNDGCGGPLAPGQSCQYDVTYTASADCGGSIYVSGMFFVPTNTESDYASPLVLAEQQECPIT